MSKLTKQCTKVCLKIACYKMCATICRGFVPNIHTLSDKIRQPEWVRKAGCVNCGNEFSNTF